MDLETFVSTADKLMKARCRLMMKEPFYGSIAMDMTWEPHDFPDTPEEAKTMGVSLNSRGAVCYYYKPFVERLSIEELYTVVQHEIEHVVRLHLLRYENRQPDVFNIACDMSIHGHKDSPKIGYIRDGIKVFPDRDRLCWVPQDCSPDLTAEEYYKRLMNNEMPSIVKITNGKTKLNGDLIDNHGVWEESDMSADEARQYVNSMVQDAISKNQGSAPGHLLDAIKALAKPVVRWRELLRRYLGQHVGNRRWTLSRRNRRNDSFGLKGVSHHAAATVNVIVDTSGSIGQAELGKFFAEIDAISSRAKTHVLQWDHAFQGYDKYRRGNWKTFKVKGRGGTDMAAPYKWLEDNGKVADVQIMLTDGYCSWAEKKEYPVITCITTDRNGPEWGHVVKLV